MTDTHTHLYMDSYENGGADAVCAAIENGVTTLIFPGVDMATLQPMLSLHEKFPDNTVIGLGLHPTELGEAPLATIENMSRMLPGEFKAIGETGIDLHWETENLELQKQIFFTHIGWAHKYGLPLIIHSRDAIDETLSVLRAYADEHNGELPTMIFHSFTLGIEDVKKIRRVCDPYFGINGVVTFKNAKEIREAIPEIGIDRIVLETDSPWLAPVPHRGQRNESAYIPYIRDKVAEVLMIPPEDVERITDRNADKIFKLHYS